MSELIEVPPAPRRLRFDPRRITREDYGSARRHSQRVRLLKFGLPGLAIVGAAIFFVTMHFDVGGGPISLAGINIEQKKLVMQAPHISGFEGTRRAYDVKAARATQDLTNPKVFTLQQITATFGTGGDATAKLDAAIGIYNGNSNLLTLKKGIALVTSDGYRAKLVEAKVDIAKGALVSKSPVEITSGDGVLTANGIEVSERGKHVKFTGGVSLNFVPPPNAFGPLDSAATTKAAPTDSLAEVAPGPTVPVPVASEESQ